MIIILLSSLWIASLIISVLITKIDLIPYIKDFHAKRKMINILPYNIVAGFFIGKGLSDPLYQILKHGDILKSDIRAGLFNISVGLFIAIFSDQIKELIEKGSEKADKRIEEIEDN